MSNKIGAADSGIITIDQARKLSRTNWPCDIQPSALIAPHLLAMSWGFLTPVSLTLGIILGCVAIWQKLQNVKRRLTVRVTRHNFEMPVDPAELLLSYREKVSGVLQNADHDISLRPQLTNLLDDDADWNLLKDLRFARSYWELHIENLARAKTLGVTVTFSRRGFIVAEVKRGDSKEIVRRNDGKLPVGDLIARDTVTVRAWSSDDHWFDPIEAVSVAHDSGVARIRRQYLVNRGWYRFAEFFRIIGWFLVILLVLLASMLLGAYLITKSLNTLTAPSMPPPHVTPTTTPSKSPVP
jgi:hypothetical protein